MTFTAGTKIRASALNQLGAIVGRNRRTTSSTPSAAIVRILSVTAPVVAGRTYRVICHGEALNTIAAAATQSELRYTTNNTEPTVTSTILARALKYHATAGVPDEVTIVGEFICTTTGTLRVALCCTRVVGTGNASWSGDALFPITLVVEDLGTTVTATGTVY